MSLRVGQREADRRKGCSSRGWQDPPEHPVGWMDDKIIKQKYPIIEQELNRGKVHSCWLNREGETEFRREAEEAFKKKKKVKKSLKSLEFWVKEKRE